MFVIFEFLNEQQPDRDHKQETVHKTGNRKLTRNRETLPNNRSEKTFICRDTHQGGHSYWNVLEYTGMYLNTFCTGKCTGKVLFFENVLENVLDFF